MQYIDTNMIFNRNLEIPPKTCFLWGPRQSGKSTLLKTRYPNADYYNLLLANQYAQLIKNPGLIRENCQAKGLTGDNQKDPIIIDEVQKVPEILDEIHWMIENQGLKFILCGSSARKLKRGQGNLLGGRARRLELHPFAFPEIDGFDLVRALNHGLLPPHYLSDEPKELLLSYVGAYLNEEILSEALTRNIGSFNRFLESASFSNGEIVNYSNISRECGVSLSTVKGYFQILEDTLIGRFLPAFRKKSKRRQIGAPKFYFFDIGIVNHLSRRGRIEPRSELFGKAFEQFMFMELVANSHYSRLHYPIQYWRTASGYEVDFVVGDNEVAVEAKAVDNVQSAHLKSMRAYKEEFRPRQCIIVSLDPTHRKTNDGIDIIPWEAFLKMLWGGSLLH